MLMLARLLHVGGAIMWTGGLMLIVLFILPALRAAIRRTGAAGGQVRQQPTSVQRMPLWLTGSAIITRLGGAYLFWLDSGHLEPGWFRTGPGMAYSTGALAGILAFLIGAVVNG